jgi:hypothetical protein
LGHQPLVIAPSSFRVFTAPGTRPARNLGTALTGGRKSRCHSDFLGMTALNHLADIRRDRRSAGTFFKWHRTYGFDGANEGYRA